MTTYEQDVVASLKKYGERTSCPFCGWSLKEPGHKIKECEETSIQIEIERKDDRS